VVVARVVVARVVAVKAVVDRVEVRDRAAVVGIPAAAAVARVPEGGVALVAEAVAAARGPEGAVVLVAEAAAAAEVRVAPVAILAVVVVVEVPAVAAGPEAAAAAAPEAPAVAVAVAVKEAVGAVVGKVRAEARVEAEDRVVATAGAPVGEATDSFQMAGGRESARRRFFLDRSPPALPLLSPAPETFCPPAGTACTLAVIPSQRGGAHGHSARSGG
jgi:hypothetical protein